VEVLARSSQASSSPSPRQLIRSQAGRVVDHERTHPGKNTQVLLRFGA